MHIIRTYNLCKTIYVFVALKMMHYINIASNILVKKFKHFGAKDPMPHPPATCLLAMIFRLSCGTNCEYVHWFFSQLFKKGICFFSTRIVKMFPKADVGRGPPCYGNWTGKICLTQKQNIKSEIRPIYYVARLEWIWQSTWQGCPGLIKAFSTAIARTHNIMAAFNRPERPCSLQCRSRSDEIDLLSSGQFSVYFFFLTFNFFTRLPRISRRIRCRVWQTDAVVLPMSMQHAVLASGYTACIFLRRQVCRILYL